MEKKDHKLDNLFREKLSDMEIPLEEDYWPFIEKNITTPTPSFYKYGWNHLNIYHLLIAGLVLLLGYLYFLNKSTESNSNTNSLPIIEKKSLLKTTDSTSTNFKHNNDENTIGKKNRLKTAQKSLPNSTTTSELKDSLIEPIVEDNTFPVTNQEAAKVIIEEKPKPKRIIYVIQQDTIVEKDTVKVRRKRKN